VASSSDSASAFSYSALAFAISASTAAWIAFFLAASIYMINAAFLA